MDKKVLYIDDEEANLFMFKMLFKDNFDLQTASSGPEGLEVLAADPTFDVVISDMNMPKMTGLEFIKKAKEMYHHISYFILTGYNIDDTMQKALQSGLLKGFMTKPMDSDKIRSIVNEAA